LLLLLPRQASQQLATHTSARCCHSATAVSAGVVVVAVALGSDISKLPLLPAGAAAGSSCCCGCCCCPWVRQPNALRLYLHAASQLACGGKCRARPAHAPCCC
jgi:hypothetical protein